MTDEKKIKFNENKKELALFWAPQSGVHYLCLQGPNVKRTKTFFPDITFTKTDVFTMEIGRGKIRG